MVVSAANPLRHWNLDYQEAYLPLALYYSDSSTIVAP